MTGNEKKDNFVHFPNFRFKMLISGTIAAMNFEPGMNIHSIILHMLGILVKVDEYMH